MAEREPIDLLLVSPGTTAGWRSADTDLRRAMEGLGLTVATCTSDYRVARHLRRGILMTDLAEAAAMRRAATRALQRHRPAAIVYSSSQATMLQPGRRLRGATALRFDAPAAINRSGAGAALLHALEQRAMRSVRLLLPAAAEPRPEVMAVLSADKPVVALPFTVDLETVRAAGTAARRGPLAVAYAGNPHKKGLDVALEAWAGAAPAGWTLAVTGLDAEEGRRFLRRRGAVEPAGVEWAGFVERDRYLELLGNASAFVAASRYEDYGIAQLEAMAAGTPLVTVPSDGPYEALPVARAVDPRLVAEEASGEALARALATALGFSAEERSAYAERAFDLLRPYSREALAERLKNQVLPVLNIEPAPPDT